MATRYKILPFTYAVDDPCASEHAAVAAWVDEAVAHLRSRSTSEEVSFDSLPSGAVFLAADLEAGRRLVMAALEQVCFWDRQSLAFRKQAQQNRNGSYDDTLYERDQLRGKCTQAITVIKTLLRRNLPLQSADLVALLGWASEAEALGDYRAPIGPIVKALERYVAKQPIDDTLRGAMQHFVRKLRTSYYRGTKQQATVVEQLCFDNQAGACGERPAAVLPPPEPALAGDARVLTEVKVAMRMLPDAVTPAETTVLAPDGFACLDVSPLAAEHATITELLEEALAAEFHYNCDLAQLKSGRKVLKLPGEAKGRFVLAVAERHGSSLIRRELVADHPYFWQGHYFWRPIVATLMESEFTTDRDGTFDLLLYLCVQRGAYGIDLRSVVDTLLDWVETKIKGTEITEGERFVLWLTRNALLESLTMGSKSGDIMRLSRLINDGAQFWLAPGEVWSDRVNEDLQKLGDDERAGWIDLVSHALTAASARPSTKWLKTAEKLIASLGEEQVSDTLLVWFSLVAQGRSVPKMARYHGDPRSASDTIHPGNADCLRGLLWCVPLLANRDELIRPVTSLAVSAFKKVPGVGPRAPKVGNACVYVLSQLGTKEAVGQLAMLKVRIKSGSAQKEIEKAFEAAAAALGLPREEIEELGVPSYGLEDVGRLVETLGDYRAELVVSGVDATLHWFDAKDKPLKSVPAKVKAEHKEELKELQQTLKDVKAMLPAQRDRLDGMFLLEKSWPIAEWRERYHDHPLVGTIAQRLLWCVDGAAALFQDGTPTDVRGEAFAHGQTAEITLWHPIGRSIEEITAWRARLEELGITQPFKQAYREVYLLTDAERNTGTYSNRFAAHIVRQHQFNALCAARGWKNKLRLMVDASYPPACKLLPNWGLRAEFWIDGIGDDYGVDTNDAGTYLRLVTDQVRFYRAGAAENWAQVGGSRYESYATGPGENDINEPIPLDEVPPLVFSEIMRDVDLFVGVSSVGNDPTWQDGGPEGRYREYWHQYSFGDLSGTATTRKQVLERLVPRLKIAERCSFSDRFLVVRGDKRTYKIHLGSGNILMEPNDQYLCIVPDARARTEQGGLYLPFDGDSVLSIIISKALLLAADTKIKDRTILRQIEQR